MNKTGQELEEVISVKRGSIHLSHSTYPTCLGGTKWFKSETSILTLGLNTSQLHFQDAVILFTHSKSFIPHKMGIGQCLSQVGIGTMNN